MSNETLAKTATFGGSLATLFGWFTVTEWCAIGGLIVALIGLLIQWGIARQKKRFAVAEHMLNMKIKQKHYEILSQGRFPPMEDDGDIISNKELDA